MPRRGTRRRPPPASPLRVPADAPGMPLRRARDASGCPGDALGTRRRARTASSQVLGKSPFDCGHRYILTFVRAEGVPAPAPRPSDPDPELPQNRPGGALIGDAPTASLYYRKIGAVLSPFLQDAVVFPLACPSPRTPASGQPRRLTGVGSTRTGPRATLRSMFMTARCPDDTAPRDGRHGDAIVVDAHDWSLN